MDRKEYIRRLSFLGAELTDKIDKNAVLQVIPAKTEILSEKQQILHVPIVMEGLVKVYARFEDKELLLYYIEPLESCVMSFSAAIHHQPSKIFATTEVESVLLLLPVKDLHFWLLAHPTLHALFYKAYDKRYTDLLSTLQEVLFNKMEDRLLDYFIKKKKTSGLPYIDFSPTIIARELGTAREVISRVSRKLEADGIIRLEKKKIFFTGRD